MIKRQINILYGIESFDGGAMKHVVYLASGLKSSEFNIHIITSDNVKNQQANNALQLLRDNGISISLIKIKHRINILCDLKCILMIRKYIKRNNISIVHAHSSKAGALFRISAYLCNIRSLYTPHCFYFVSLKGFKRRLYILIERLLGRITDTIVLSENEKHVAIVNKIVTKDKLVVINNVISADQYKRYVREEVLNKYGIPDSKVIAGGVGRLAKQKHWETYIMAASKVVKKYPKTIFIIAGDGPERASLESLIGELGLGNNIKLLGDIGETSEVYSIIDIFVSSSDWEGLPYTYLEAVHYGIPMIISDTDHLDTVIDRNKCAIYSRGNYMQLAGILIEYIRDRNFKSKRPGLLVDETMKSFIDKHKELYRSLIG